MKSTFYILFVLGLLGLSACTQVISITPTIALTSGIEGYVTMGPVCPGPVMEGDTSCQDKPYQANLTILDSQNKQISQFQTDEKGYFKVSLPPGTYNLHPESGNTLPIASDQTVVVTEGQYAQVTIQYDTGIR